MVEDRAASSPGSEACWHEIKDEPGTSTADSDSSAGRHGTEPGSICPDGSSSAGWWNPSRRTKVLCILVFVFVANQATRALPFYLVNFSEGAGQMSAMNMALHFESGKYGAFATLGFTVPFTLASLAAGVLADSADRMKINAIAGLAWSTCTVLMASTETYGGLLCTRMLLGLSQAITNPASLSLIAEMFPDARATTSSIYGLGIYVGGGVASLGAALDASFGWRTSCIVFGGASAAISLLPLLYSDQRPQGERPPTRARERIRTGSDCGASANVDAEPQGLAAFIQRVKQVVPSAFWTLQHRILEATSTSQARWLLLASTFRFCAGFAILVWLPSAIHTRFPNDIERFAVYNSLIKAFAGGASSLAGGVTADVMRSRGLGDRAGALFCACASLVAAPLWYLVLHEGISFEMSMFCLLLEYLAAESWLGPAVATLQGAVPPERRGAAQGVFSSLTALGNALPTVLGFLHPDDLALGLQVSVAVCYALSAGCFLVVAGARGEERTVVEEERFSSSSLLPHEQELADRAVP